MNERRLMARPFNTRIEDLRKKSRTLISRLKETSKRVNDEVCQMRSQSSSHVCLASSRGNEYWRMRNDSGGVGGVLCPNYFHSEDNGAEYHSGKAAMGKIVITSNGHSAHKLPRKPVRGCYCYSKTKKLQAEKTTDETSFPCTHCRSKFDVVEMDSSACADAAVNVFATVLPPLSGETLRRVEKITYSPTSEFLRRVQKNVSSQKKKPTESCCVFSTSSSSSHERSARIMTRDSGRGESAAEIRCRVGKKSTSGKRGEVRSRSETRVDREIGERRSFAVCKDNRGLKVDRRATTSRLSPRSSSVCTNDRGLIRNDEKKPTRKDQDPRRKPRSSLKKKLTRSVDRRNDEQRRTERGSTKNPTRVKRIVRTISAHSRCCAHENVGIPSVGMESRKIVDRSRARCDCGTRECSEGYRRTNWQLSRDTNDPTDVKIGDRQDKVSDLKKFRQDNYFETHGSVQTLVASSRSSGSLEQYELNERLFPEPVRRIHRDDIVVTMPPCATKQRKRIHYFPRHIVNQEKSVSNTNYKKKRRSQSCGLTGHAIDLGVFKIPRDVSNSLALKYQKGVRIIHK